MSEPVFQCWPGELRALVSDGNFQQAGRWLLEAVRLALGTVGTQKDVKDGILTVPSTLNLHTQC